MSLLNMLLKFALGLLMMAAGLNHFRNPSFYLRMMPDYLPSPEALVVLSGLAEMLVGALLLVPRFSRLAAWALIALLLAVFPANVNMALHPEQFPEFSSTGLWVRLPIQGLLILWAWWYTRPEAPAAPLPRAG
ncbi:MAG TPA: DoxX family membrane protein [Myxococcaceae bacterium]|nr:DoxX family membrane protein [Myxococcaceae bacterium]